MNEINQELKSVLINVGFGEYLEMLEFNEVFEIFIPELLNIHNARLENMLNAIDCMNRKDYAAARKNLGVNENWTFISEKIFSTRAIAKSLITGLLHIRDGYLKNNPKMVYKIWEHYVPMYVPHVKRFYSIDSFFPHPGNTNNFCFHHFINYQRFLNASDSENDIEKFMAFIHNYLFEMFFILADQMIAESRNLLLNIEKYYPEQVTFFKEVSAKNADIALLFIKISNTRNQQFINQSFMKYNFSSLGVNNIADKNSLKILSGNMYRRIPSEVLQNHDIKELVIINSNIDCIPDEIKEMENLERFHFSGSKLIYLSPEVFKLPKIIDVDVIDPYFYPNEEITLALGHFMERNTHRYFGENIWNLEHWQHFKFK